MDTESIFAIGLDFVFRIEGIESDDPDDGGGHTLYGISASAHPDAVIECRDDAVPIYRDDYWYAFSCDKIAQTQPAIALLMFDAAVQHRPKTAITLIQEPIQGIAHDGVIGPQTLGAIEHVHLPHYVPHHFSYRAELYADIVKGNHTQAKYLRGWQRRLFCLQGWLFMNGFLDTVEV